MAATTVKNDPIKNDKMKFRTQMVDGKPQIFFDAIDDSSTKTKSKRNGRTISNTSRLIDQQKSKINNQQSSTQNGNNKQTTKTEQSSNKIRVNEDGSNLGVYMTMDELAELVKAVKDNSKNDNNTTTTETKAERPPQQHNETNTAPIVPKLDLPTDPHPLPAAQISPREHTLSIMAEKKRQKWIRDKAEIERMQLEIEYDQLKHQLSPRHKKTSVSPERSTFQYDFPPPPPPLTSKPPPAPPLPPSLKQNDHHYDVSPKVNEDANNDVFKTRLMEKKQQQWKQENSEKLPLWNPFGRPGAGAPNTNENPPRISQPPSNGVVPYRPPVPQQQFDHSSSSLPPTFVHSDQTHIPAAMRTNLLFGDVRFDEDVKTAKEIERRQWLDDLRKQIEENKRKKYTQQETERRQDFLNENVQPILQEAANRHQQQRDIPTKNNSGQDLNKFYQRDSSVQQPYNKILEAGDLATYDKRSRLIDNLKHDKSTGPTSNQKTGEKIFGPTYDSSSKQNTNNKIESLHLNVAADHQQPYRFSDTRRDEAVNTVDTTFRSDHGVQTDLRFPSHRPTAPYAYEESDLPPQIPNHQYRNSGYRNIPNQSGKKSSHTHSLDDNRPTRRTSTTTYNSNPNDDGAVSQISSQRSNHGPIDIHHRPLWNYNNREHREYIPNSKRDPHYERRQRLKHFEQGNFDRIDDVQKKTCYNRWNSDSELQQQRKPIPTNRVRSTISKPTSYSNHKDESIMNLLKMQHKQQQETFGTRKSALNHLKPDDYFNSNRESSLDKHENGMPYTRTDEMLDPSRAYSPVSRSRETSPHKQLTETNTNNNYQQQEWDNTNRQNPPPQSRQEHILQQLSAIKENLVRRQRELASSMNVIPV